MSATEAKDSEKVCIVSRVSRDDRNWFRAAASIEGMSIVEWLYAMACRRAQEMDVPRPRPRG